MTAERLPSDNAVRNDNVPFFEGLDLVNGRIGELNGGYAKLFKICLTAGPLFVTCGLAAQGWVLSRLADVDQKISSINERQAVMEGNRFSSSDGLRVWEAIGKIREEQAKFPTEYPPKWFVDRVDRIEKNVDKLAEQTLQLSRVVAETHKQ